MLGEKVCRRGLVTHWSAGVERSRPPPRERLRRVRRRRGEEGPLGARWRGTHCRERARLGRQTMRTIVLVYLVFGRPDVPGVNRSGVKLLA